MRRSLVVYLAIVWAGCGPSARNNGGGGPDTPGPSCIEGQHRCTASTYQVCSNGDWITQEDCLVACNELLGCVQCQPGENVCKDGNVHTCDAGGNVGGEVEACTGSNVCQGGVCVNACEDAATKKSYIGCEYWAADLDNAVEVVGVQGSINCSLTPGVKNVTMQACGDANNMNVAGMCDPPGNTCPASYTCKSMSVCILDAQKSPFAIVVANPQTRAVMVTVTPAVGQPFSQSVAAGQVVALQPQSPPASIPDQSVDGTGKETKAYKVTSELPIVAYQFNPLDNVNVFSNDGSLLIPRTAWDVDHYAMSWPTSDRRTPAPGAHSYHGYLAIVAHQDNTVVEVTATATVRASAAQVSIPANTPTMFTLAAHDVLTLQAAPGGDLTGTKVTSVDGTTTYGVFGGHEAMGFGEMTPPNPMYSLGPCCADHLEDMIFPTSTWGKTFAIARSQSRMTNEPDVLRIMAQKPNTTVMFDPAPNGSCPTLQPGQHCQVKIAADTSITASEPILVGHFLESAIWQDPFFGGAVGEGDPSMAIGVPTEQYRTEYTILVPNQYTKNFMSISAPANGAVLVDNLPIAMTPFAGGNYRAARHQVTAGQHKISCPSGCGVVVYGYSDAVSYMFAGGLDLKQIVIN